VALADEKGRLLAEPHGLQAFEIRRVSELTIEKQRQFLVRDQKRIGVSQISEHLKHNLIPFLIHLFRIH
jgi:hypothetical protein